VPQTASAAYTYAPLTPSGSNSSAATATAKQSAATNPHSFKKYPEAITV
jgi:hypothetical protein